jgi:cell wall-associated NlpC family hydrolase
MPLEIPRGAILPLIEPPSGANSVGKIFVMLVDGTSFGLPQRTFEIIQPNPERSRKKIMQLAQHIMGVKYIWGGSTDRGLDCSGFTNHMYGLIGVNIPRDADQQSAVGKIVAFRGYFDNLLPGDLLFFLGRTGRVSHVSMSLGGLDFIHSSNPDLKIGSFDSESPFYEARYKERFAFARRILAEGFRYE